MNTYLLKVQDLALRYLDAREPVINGLDFFMEKGEILSLHGASGAGKSTIVWALMGMLNAYGIDGSGTISFAGENINLKQSPRGLCRSWDEIALVPQSSMCALNPVRTIQQTFLEMMRAHEPGISKADCILRSQELMEMVRLQSQILSAYPHELSGGMKQRISIALAVMYHPSLLILDEATTGLDLLVEADILGTVRKLKEQFDMSILMITHDQRLSDAFCHRRIQIGGNK